MFVCVSPNYIEMSVILLNKPSNMVYPGKFSKIWKGSGIVFLFDLPVYILPVVSFLSSYVYFAIQNKTRIKIMERISHRIPMILLMNHKYHRKRYLNVYKLFPWYRIICQHELYMTQNISNWYILITSSKGFSILVTVHINFLTVNVLSVVAFWCHKAT